MKNSIFFYGNCNASLIKNMINSINLITDEYDLVVINSGKCQQYWSEAIEELAARCVILIEQNLTDKIGSRDFLYSKLPRGIINIKFPPSVFTAFWPFSYEDRRNRDSIILPEGPYPSYLCNKYVSDKISFFSNPEKVVDNFLDMDINKLVDLDRLYELCISQIEMVEKSCEIKVSNFIEKNYQNMRLFLMPLHPTGIMMSEMVGQILNELNILPIQKFEKYLKQFNNFYGIGAYDAPIHPQIIEHFKLKWAENLKFRHFQEGEFSYREYLIRYIKFKYTKSYYDGLHELNLGNFKDASILFQKAVKINPSSKDFHISLIRCLIILGDYKKAYETSKNAISIFNDNIDILYEYLLSAYHFNKYRESYEAINKIINYTHLPYKIYWYKSNVEVKLGLKADAEESIRKYYWLRSRSQRNVFTEDTGAEFGRYWIGPGGNGY